MKLKVAIASVAVVTIAVVAFSFTTAKKFTSTLQYNPPFDKREIAASGSDAIDASQLNVSSNWTSGLPSVTYTSNGMYLRAIQFEEETTADGPSDGMLTQAEAEQAVKDYFVNNSASFPQDGAAIVVGTAPNTTSIIVRRSNDNN